MYLLFIIIGRNEIVAAECSCNDIFLLPVFRLIPFYEALSEHFLHIGMIDGNLLKPV